MHKKVDLILFERSLEEVPREVMSLYEIFFGIFEELELLLFFSSSAKIDTVIYIVIVKYEQQVYKALTDPSVCLPPEPCRKI